MKTLTWITAGAVIMAAFRFANGAYSEGIVMLMIAAVTGIPLGLIKFYQRLKVGIAADRR